MSTRDSKLRINIDIAQAKTNAKQLATDLTRLGQAGRQGGQAVAQGMNQATQGINRAAEASAAASIRFQTMTQGMINLTTASVQTFTSISNLARAENRAKASTIAVSRAVDLLNNKRERLNDLLRAGAASEQKMANIRREIATATADLTVKQEKMKIETDAVLDIQLLFMASLLNVGVSTYAIISSMVGVHTKMLIKNAIATKFNTLSQFNNRNALFGNTIQRRINTLSLTRNALGYRLATTATRLQTIALHGLKIALGPIGLIFIGISAAMVLYETNALGLKDTINSLLGIVDEEAEALREAEEATKDLDEATGGLGKTMFKMPTSLAQAVKALELMKIELRDVEKQAIKTGIATGAILAVGGGATQRNFR